MKPCRSLFVSGIRCAFFAASCCFLTSTSPAQDPLVDLTGSWQLFVDDYLVAETTNVSRSYYQFQKVSSEPVLEADQPWESDFVYTYGSVLPQEDGDGYRMWYHSYSRTDGTTEHVRRERRRDHLDEAEPGCRIYGGSTGQ